MTPLDVTDNHLRWVASSRFGRGHMIKEAEPYGHPARRGEVCRTSKAEGRDDGRGACLGGTGAHYAERIAYPPTCGNLSAYRAWKGRGVPAEALRALRNSLRMGAEIDL
jgi:hypothetical protein